MILHRFGRLAGVLLLLAPSLALGQTTLQQPCTDRTRGCTVISVPAALDLLYANDVALQGLVGTRFGQLGTAAFLNVGTLTGTVADGGALTSEIARAKAAEQANTTAIQTNATAISTETSRAQGVEATKAPLSSPTFTGVPAGPTAGTGTSTAQLATTAFVAAAVAAGAGGNQGVPPSRQILASGLATGGGDLTADRTITVPKAAQSDVAAGTDDAKALTSYSVAAALGAKAPLASPALVGTPTAPTAAAGTSTTQLATTAFVAASTATSVAKTGDTMTGNLTIKGAYASLFLTQNGGTYNGQSWVPIFGGDDGRLYFQKQKGGAFFSNPIQFDELGAITTAQLGDLKTYIDNSAPKSGAVVNSARAQTAATSTTSTQTPISDAAPTTSNTTAVSGLSTTITPRSATNKLRVRAVVQGSLSTVGAFVAAVFRDSGTSAVAANYTSIAGNGYNSQIQVTYEVAAGSTAATTFSVGVGSNNSGTLTINGTGGGRLFGGVAYSSIEVTEILP